jgi:hypothetical protein
MNKRGVVPLASDVVGGHRQAPFSGVSQLNPGKSDSYGRRPSENGGEDRRPVRPTLCCCVKIFEVVASPTRATMRKRKSSDVTRHLHHGPCQGRQEMSVRAEWHSGIMPAAPAFRALPFPLGVDRPRLALPPCPFSASIGSASIFETGSSQ